MKNLIEILNYKANNLEEICCGIRHNWKDYENKQDRIELINEIEAELELFIKALTKLKEI